MTRITFGCLILAAALLVVIALNGVEMQIGGLQDELKRTTATSHNLDQIAAAIPSSALRTKP